jgi:hypothetical protein
MDVAARAKIVSGASENDDFDVVGVQHGSKKIAQLGVGVEGERIFSLWPI